MKLSDIHLRDPFVLPSETAGGAERCYYLYGTEGPTAWKGNPRRFIAYRSRDLVEWEAPVTIFKARDDFWPTENYWAPEIHAWRGRFYLFASFKAPGTRRGTQALVADHPLGPFRPIGGDRTRGGGPLTPRDWECLDGTFYVDAGGRPWMIFCHEWVQVGDGEICAVRLSEDLDRTAGEPKLLFRASEAQWVRPIRGGPNYVTDGPFVWRRDAGAPAALTIIWSSFDDAGYALGCARSESGTIDGPWRQDDVPLYHGDGGHGMVFTAFDGARYLAVHSPNDTPNERPKLVPLA